MAEKVPVPADVTGVDPEVRTWAEELVGLRKKPRTSIVDVPTDAISGGHLRVIGEPDLSGIGEEDLHVWDSLVREAFWIDRQHTQRLPEIKGLIIYFEGQFPEGVIGFGRDRSHGNLNLQVIHQRVPEFDDPTIESQLTSEEHARVYGTETVLKLAFEDDLPTADGGSLSPEAVTRIMRHALLGAGVSEELIESGLKSTTEGVRRNRAIAALIIEERITDGITIADSPRVEMDAIDKHRATSVRRPRERVIKKPTRQSAIPVHSDSDMASTSKSVTPA